MVRKLAVATLTVVLHLAANAAHGVPHAAIPVPLAAWQRAFVFGVVALAPLVALGFLWRGQSRAGAGLLAVSMAASLAFGLYFHFGAPNPDHVDAVRAGPWRSPFRTTAVLVAAIDAVGALVGLWLAYEAPDSSVGDRPPRIGPLPRLPLR
ncbi:hypothetical protein M0R89_17305 [Halorussus limi]|uniref:Uncharacterized protein n=1 Tax=Halorussus limi TaxID=2938695 RepID=A0A8U0HU28_9EURY|nr:hypothetical protein [Halorussus limi]UPV74281.1 hypothetical protein M0R89_17305 [Halorussus limi]